MLAEDPNIHASLHGIAQSLTPDFHLCKDLVQEAFVCLVELENDEPNQKPTWYLKACKNCMIDYLRSGTCVDSLKRRHLGCDHSEFDENGDWLPEGLIAKECVLSAVAAADLASQVSERLRPVEREVLELLMKGYGEGEIAAQFRVTRQAIAKVRHKIRLSPASQSLAE